MDALKQAVYEANMELNRRGLVVYTWGNVSQVDRARGVFAIKPSGVPYEELKADDIAVVSLESGECDGPLRPSSDAPTHLAIYRAFAEISGVAHTHSPSATAWAQAGLAIPCYGTTHADYFYGDVPVTRFLTEAEIAGDYEYATGLVIAEAFAGRSPMESPAALVRGHGPFTWGESAGKAVFNAVVLEEVAGMALCTRSLNQGVSPLPDSLARKHFFRKHGANAYYGQINGSIRT